VARSRGSRFPRSSGASLSRSVAWEVGPQSSANGLPLAFTSTSSAVGIIASALVDSLTLVRLRGYLVAWLSSATAAGDGFSCAIGVGKATSAALAIGVTAIPTPITEDSWDGWLYHKFFGVFSGAGVSGDASVDSDMVNPTSAATRFEIDSKAMRKIDIDEAFFVAFEVVLHGTAQMEIAMNSRMLCKAPR